jgi:hypothetical protein
MVSIPAGSFKWDKFVKSSLASSMAGFISGGRFGSLPVLMPFKVVSTVFFCEVASSAGALPYCPWPLLVVCCVPRHSQAGRPASPCRRQSACRRAPRQPSRLSGRAAMPGCRSRRCAPWWWSCPAPYVAVVGDNQGPRLPAIKDYTSSRSLNYGAAAGSERYSVQGRRSHSNRCIAERIVCVLRLRHAQAVSNIWKWSFGRHASTHRPMCPACRTSQGQPTRVEKAHAEHLEAHPCMKSSHLTWPCSTSPLIYLNMQHAACLEMLL